MNSDSNQIRRVMEALVLQNVAHSWDCPDSNFVNLTELAEAAAHELNHDEWLDDESHEVWEVAIVVAEAADPKRAVA